MIVTQMSASLGEHGLEIVRDDVVEAACLRCDMSTRAYHMHVLYHHVDICDPRILD
jgi:hypothetical protein